jgi:hypothetical protein
MNEHKIRLIADQVTEWCQQHAHGAPTAWEWEYKFAELIVQECCNEISQEPFNAGAASAWLKQYFGVE